MSDKKPSFEESVARLDEIVAKLEKGDIPLDDALGLFGEGTALVKLCSGLLDAAEQKVTQLSKGSGGELSFEPFDEEQDD